MSSISSVVPPSIETSLADTGFDKDTVFKILKATVRLFSSELGRVLLAIILFTLIGII